MRRSTGTAALAGMAAAAALAAPAHAALPAPPAGHASYTIGYACQEVTTSGGYPQVRVSGTATSTVLKRPKKPRFIVGPHEIYQEVKISVQRRALGSWKGDQRTFTTTRTRKGALNTGQFSHGALYSPSVAVGATFRIRLIARVLTYRRGLPDHRHWKLQVWTEQFSCPPSVNLGGPAFGSGPSS